MGAAAGDEGRRRPFVREKQVEKMAMDPLEASQGCSGTGAGEGGGEVAAAGGEKEGRRVAAGGGTRRVGCGLGRASPLIVSCPCRHYVPRFRSTHNTTVMSC